MANWPIARIDAWNTLLKARAIENMTYVIGVNRLGLDANNYKYSGSSQIINYFGEIVSMLPQNDNGIISSALCLKTQNNIRHKLGFLNDRDVFSVKVF